MKFCVEVKLFKSQNCKWSEWPLTKNNTIDEVKSWPDQGDNSFKVPFSVLHIFEDIPSTWLDFPSHLILGESLLLASQQD